MTSSNQSLCRKAGFLIVCCAALLTAACGKTEKKAPTQVAVKINGEEVSEHQVSLLIERHAPASAGEPAAVRRVLDGLVDQELAAQAARKAGLDKDPRVVQRMEAAKRDVLALAYLDRLGESVSEPTSDEVDRYFNAHPELFSQRRLYSLQDTTIAIDPAQYDELKARLEASSSLDKMNEVLRAASVRSTSRQLSISAEDVPLVMLKQLAALKDGQSMVQPREPGSARVLTLINAQPSPVSHGTAKKLISAFLIKDRRRQASQTGIKALRDQGKVEFVGRFAAAASAASAPAPSAPAPAPVPATAATASGAN